MVGVGCRFPGSGEGVEGFWDLLTGGESGVGLVPGDRWDVEAFFDADPEVPGRSYARHGGFVDGVREFDAGLFGIPPREAVRVDPQHRLVLEVAWEALEHAGIAPDSLRGSRTGVFVGMGGSDYERLTASGGDVSGLDGYTATGGALNFAANRVSYVLGLEGPSMVVDTACSSSLVALHLACQALRAGECERALVGGVNLLLSPGTTVALSKARMLSPEGQCKTFDASADGYVRGEGCGVVVLRPLADALADGQDVLAVVKGSAVNQDGRSNGLTAPRGSAQQAVIRRALAVGGVAPGDVGYVEAHGTGTPLGDPIEVRALASVLGEGRAVDRPVVLGSVKTNIGHLEAAAGIAGLIKTVLAVGRGVIPPHLNMSTPNPLLAWDELPVRVATELTPWNEERRVAGVSSFGFGGTNAHVIVESPPAPADTTVHEAAGEVAEGPVVVKVSGRNEDALRASAQQLAAAIRALGEDVQPRDVAWAAGVGRADLPQRAAVVAASATELAERLDQVADGTLRGRPAAGAPRVGFVVPGQGARLAGVLAGLHGRLDAVTEAVDEVASVVGGLSAPPLSVLLDSGAEAAAALAETDVAQLALYTTGVALGSWWKSVGVAPDVVTGHSVGAYAAAALAGVFSVADGARLVAARARLMADLPRTGTMAALFCGPGDLAGIPGIESGTVEIAAYNSPRETVVSGPREAVADVVARIRERGTRAVPLRVSHAFHSAQMDPVLAPFAEAFDGVRLHEPALDFVSDLTGELAGPEPATVDYWLRHARQAVRFADAGRTLLADDTRIVVELGTGGLLPHVVSAAGSAVVTCLPSVASDGDSHRRLLESLARVWADGVPVDWARANGPRPARLPKLPTYPFQRQTYWEPSSPPVPPGTVAAPAATPPRTAPQPAPAARTAPLAASSDSRDERVAALIAHLRRELAAVMELDDAGALDADTGLFDLGLTSTMVVELRVGIERALGRQIPTTAVFDHPTIRRLAAYLADLDVAAPAAPDRSVERAGGAGTGTQPLAIVGMGCRFPGGANDLDAYWRLLARGGDATSSVPEDRWDRDAFYDPDPAAPGKAYTYRGGFLDVPVDQFDAEAFGIAPREARSMDPQQRLLLEVASEALADAGCTTARLAGSRTAVYVGINTSDYMQLLSADGTHGIDPYQATGNTFSVAAGRLSYLLGAQGPSMAVDTACSSSLVAAHLAARSLRSGEADLAIVAGVNLMLAPGTTVSLAKLGALSPDGRCKTFDASADGYGRGEGCGVVVLKRLSEAVADGDRVWAVLHGSAVNQDGRSAGLTVPNGQAQQAVIREALRSGGTDPAEVGYVEAHGTGTPLGDPMEIGALVEVLRPDLETAAPLTVGSVKTNIGHLEAAAGISGLIKVALSLHHGKIPPHLHFDTPNPHLAWDRLPVEIPAKLTEWKQAGGTRTAGLSSFGFSGTNAHLILGEAPPDGRRDSFGADTPQAVPTAEPSAELLLLSARTPDALTATGEAYGRFLAAVEGEGANDRAPEGALADRPGWADITRTAALDRDHLTRRTAVVARSAGEAAKTLTAAANAARATGIRHGAVVPAEQRRLLFVYSGQGCQWPGMGRGLLADPTAARVLHHCDVVVQRLAGWSLVDELVADRAGSRLADTVIAQPAVLAVQAALTEVWRSWGITPDAVLGHSVGEVGAAYAAGAIDLDTALEIVVRRGEVMGAGRGQGAMAAVGMGAGQVADLIAPYGDQVTVAAVNSPVSTVLAGDPAALAEVEKRVRERRAQWATVQKEYAFHSPYMLPFQADLERALAHLPAPAPAGPPVLSTVTGGPAEPGAFDTGYWCANMVSPVRFADAVRAAAGDEAHTAVVEIGPHSVLRSAVTQTLADRAEHLTVLGSMRTGADSRSTLLDAAGALHVLGYDLAHEAIQPPNAPRVSLPAYPWQRQRHWLPARPVSTVPGTPRHADDVDTQLAENSYELEWRTAEAPQGPEEAGEGTWLLVADRQGVAGRVAALLRATGADCRLLTPEEAEGPLPVDLPVRGLLHLGTLDAAPDARTPGAELDAALAVSCGPLLWAARSLGVTDGHPAPRLWLVTRGGAAVDGTGTTPSHAPVWGLGRVVALEHPEMWGGSLDLDPAAADLDADAAAVVAEVLRADGEDQVAYRGGARKVARLRAADALDPGTTVRVDADAAYLVTGGRGALGLRIARWLAGHGARHLVLTGRRPLSDDPDDPAVRAVAELRDAGVAVHTPAVDVADAEGMAAVFDACGTEWPALRGVVHAAGLFDPCAIQDMSWEQLRTVLRPKVEGTLVLDALADRAELDFFVMFSSASSVWGSALAGHYAAANYFQDVMAHDRAGRGLPALAVNWGWWAGSDMVSPEHVGYFESMGLYVLPDRVGFTALDRLLGDGRHQMTVAPVNWDIFRPVLEAKRRRPLLELLGTATTATDTVDQELLDRLREAPAAVRRRLLEDRLREETAVVLGGTLLERDAGFFEVGMDSITSVELKTRVDAVLGVRLPATATFEHPTIAALAEYLLTEVLPPETPRTTEPAPPEDEPAEEFDDLSEDELLRLLGEELER
ncbi:type I polyketide synthase [Streptomyces sp. NBC_00847]|uniref:type I polyketide synthase n=1 Tax=Streptomyces sp. NBC_00847 TaxID=2975850 RepID=UPI00225E43F4|nr:type I polyketide synthase [Streptomyces sp. NBC_00847]MCX4883657.1 SDR family NAD(P)-dependent oxidoreductase [Streptomyces sp. NBC_00847]